MKPNIDLTDNRDFSKTERGVSRRRVALSGLQRNIGRVKRNAEDEFIRRLYSSDSLNYLLDNMKKTCDRCGKYDYFNLMKTGLCHKCDELLDEECKVEIFLTGNRELRKLKRSKKLNNSLERVWWL